MGTCTALLPDMQQTGCDLMTDMTIAQTNCVDNGPREGLQTFLEAASDDPDTVLHYEFMQVRCPVHDLDSLVSCSLVYVSQSQHDSCSIDHRM